MKTVDDTNLLPLEYPASTVIRIYWMRFRKLIIWFMISALLVSMLLLTYALAGNKNNWIWAFYAVLVNIVISTAIPLGLYIARRRAHLIPGNHDLVDAYKDDSDEKPSFMEKP